ncbi:MAG: tetratricopeptide repeat protein [Desulfobacterales bacterium]|nr:tetratricopeptide repeat protein [Desulfobacterales bacterium]
MHRPRCSIVLAAAVLLFLSIPRHSNAQESDLEKARLLMQQAEKLYQQGCYNDAIPIAENALTIRERVLGSRHADVATILNNLAMLYLSLGNYAQAEPMCKRALRIMKRSFGFGHPNVAVSLNNLAGVYHGLGDYVKAEALYKRALAINEKAFGSEHPDVATNLNNLAGLYRDLGEYAKAASLYKRGLAICEKVLGPEHPHVARSLHNLAALYRSVGYYAEAKPMYKRALKITKKALGPEHPDVATCLNGLAGVCHLLADYAKAEVLYKEALTIYENVLGPEHPSVTTSLNNLALLYLSLGNYTKAASLCKRALAIDEKILGPEHPDVATSLNNLAALYLQLEDYAKAESLYKRALAIDEKILGPEHPGVAGSLQDLAALYRSVGDYAKAKSLYKRALGIIKKALGPEHPDVATCLNGLAGVYRDLGDYAKAELLYKRALAINENAFGPEHPDVATNLNNLAGTYEDLGDHAKAASPYKRVLAICEKVLGPEHPRVATSLNNLAAAYRSVGYYAEAEPLYKRSLEITKKVLGPEHPDVAAGLHNLALLYASMDDFEMSHNLFGRAQKIDGKFMDQVMGFTTEDQKIKFVSTREWSLHAFLSLINGHLSLNPLYRVDALSVWLNTKGVISGAHKSFQEALVNFDDTQAVETFQELSGVRTQISKLAFAVPGREDMEVLKRKFSDLEAQEDRLKTKLSRLSQAFALKQEIAAADCEMVARELPAGTVLIEVARVEMFDFKAKGKQKKWQPAHYLAFVLHAGNGDKVGMIDLGDAEEIDKAAAELKKEIFTMKKKAMKSSGKICNLVFEPLRKELGNVKEIFISPDGILNLIPFEVLVGPDGRYLIEDFTFNYLGSGRDVVGFGQFVPEGKGVLLMGDPDFDLAHEKKKLTLREMALMNGGREKIARRSADMRGYHFTRRPGTGKEVESIKDILGNSITTETYLGDEALEEVLKQKGPPRILHLATHGFFLNDQEPGKVPAEPTGRWVCSITTLIKGNGGKARIEPPLLRSGFVLAGANSSLQVADEQVDDGIVTSEEILGLRLRGTDMVVLSACDTGLGEVKTGEGVFGLRRAFAQAGVRSLIMSMWAAPDKETRELMVEFYKNIMTGEMNCCQALRQAALKEMKIVKERYGHAHPLYWGGFVMLGDPGQALENVNVE